MLTTRGLTTRAARLGGVPPFFQDRIKLRAPHSFFTRWQPFQTHPGFPLLLLLLLSLGLVVRLGFLAWQPLWADEGYSVYFATESTTRLFWLTAHDIHPPLYYLLLHGWLRWATPEPVALRLFSVLLATPVLLLGGALAQTLFRGRRRPQLLFLLLLVLNPFYLYYSQEVRMYGLALSLSMAGTLCCWHWVSSVKAGKAALGWLVLYTVTAMLSLYTLYYLAFLLLAHLLWVSWTLRKRLQALLHFGVADLVVGLLYLPWVIYTAQILIAYVNDKIRSDQDVALGPWDYWLRHLLAFTSGHLPFPTRWALLPWLAFLMSSGLLLWSLGRRRDAAASALVPAALPMLWVCFAIPMVAAFLVNRYYPFFPVGGERLLLFLLPYFLLLVVGALDDLWQQRQLVWRILGRGVFLVFIMTAVMGVWLFYTLPRYQEDDYRPLIRQIVQQGRDADSVLATFPWQVGFWRAYAPQAGLTATAGPHLQLMSDRAVVWGPAVAARVDEALAHGMIWIPSLRSIGSTLPAEIDRYLAGRAVNFAHRWASATTQLDGWQRTAPFPTASLAVDWGDVMLVSAGVSITTLTSANSPLVIALEWQAQPTLPADGVTLRLQKDDRSWAHRDYDAVGTFITEQQGDLLLEQVGLIVPAGLPPGDYQLVIGLVGDNGELRKPVNGVDSTVTLIPLATITVTPPDEPVPPFRLPIQFPLPQPILAQGAALLGRSGGDSGILAGTLFDLTLFWQSQRTLSDHHLYLSLLDDQGAGVAGWEGWPLPTYPLSQWSPGALVQTPVAFLIPATVASGDYRLVAGLLDPVSGNKQPPMVLGAVQVYQRQATFTPTAPPIPLAAPAQFGTHVQLLGYELDEQGDQLALTLYWQVLQPLLPPHQIFVHLDDSAGVTVAQTDDTPHSAGEAAPTGSWQPGEYLVTQHTLTTAVLPDPTAVLRVGLYVPATGARLPLSIDGAPAGDALVLQRKP